MYVLKTLRPLRCGAEVSVCRGRGGDVAALLGDSGTAFVGQRASRASSWVRDGQAVLSVRPEHLGLQPPGGDAPQATVTMVLPLGAHHVLDLALAGGGTVKVSVQRHGDGPAVRAGDRVGLQLRPGAPAAVFLPEA